MPHGYFISGGWGFTIPQPPKSLASSYPIRNYDRPFKLSVHITHWAADHRTAFLKRQIEALNDIEAAVDVFVHTNVDRLDVRHAHNVVEHEISEEYCHFLSWKHKALMVEQLPHYDAFLYLEDDILFGNQNLNYWFKNHEVLRAHDCYAGFVRYESDGTANYATDITPVFGQCTPLPRISLGGSEYWENTNNFYNGCWILDNVEMQKFVKLPQWDLTKCDFYGNFIREKPAIGPIPFYDKVLLDLDDLGCYVHHMPNNYIGHDVFCKSKLASLK